LNALNAQTSAKPSAQPPPDWDPDSHRYVEQLQQQSTLKMIADGISRAQRNFDAYLEENIDINWEVQRRKIYEHFGLVPKGTDKFSDLTSYSNSGGKGSFGRSKREGPGSTVKGDTQNTPNRSIYGKSGMQKSVIGTPGAGLRNASLFKDVAEKSPQRPNAQDEPYLREKQARFADKVQRLNEARIKELPYPILHEFADVEGQPGRDVSNEMKTHVEPTDPVLGSLQISSLTHIRPYLR
jgi:nuclear pore complex protein Nup93